jgi:hypothetical protein
VTSILLGALTVLALTSTAVWTRALLERRQQGAGGPAADGGGPTIEHLGIGLVTDFFDALGIGDFAPTTSIFRLRKLVPDGLGPDPIW